MRVNESLRPAEQGFDQLVAGVSDYAILRLDPTGKVVSWNAGAERTKGYRSDEILGQHFSRFYPAESIEAGWPEKELQRAEAEGRFEDEGWRIRKDGSRFWANVVITALRNQAGTIVGFSKVTRDLTERKQAEESLLRSNAELEVRVGERTTELADANAVLQKEVAEKRRAQEAAEAATRAKDDFLSVLSHELRTPLTPVLASTSALEAHPDLDPDLRDDVAIIRRNIEHEARLIDDLLDLTDLLRGEVRLHLEAVDAHTALRAALESRQPIIAAKRIEVTFGLWAGRPLLWADPSRLRQVFWNLLDNAVKHTPEGGKITLRSSNVENGRIVVQVADTGGGIDPEALPRIFDAFEQAERAVRAGKGGLGLGLSLSRRLVEMHGGQLTAASEGRGRGATFTLDLATIAADPERSLARSSAVAAGQGLSILLVEDHEDTLRIIARLLERQGYTVRPARSVSEALDLAAGERFDLLVSDLNLPDGSGHDVMRFVKERYGLRGIALSGFGREVDIQRSRDAGFQAHLVKPVDIQVLSRKIEAVAT